MKNNTNYFSHDCNARNDEKIMKLRATYDRSGYGIYFAIVEILSEATGYKLELDTINVISKIYQFDNDVIMMLFDIGLLLKDDKCFWSDSLLRRMELKDIQKKKYSKAGKKGMSKRWGEQGSNNDVITSKVKQSKVKEIKVKETIINNAIALEQAPEFGDHDVNSILEKIKIYNNNIIDGTVKEQRQYGKMLFDKLKQIDSVKNNNYSAAGLLEIILQIISKNEYHSHKIVGPKKIYYELAGLMQICKQEFKKEDKNKIPFIKGI